MPTVAKFEDLKAWQKARELVREVYRITSGNNDFVWRDQLRRAAVSVALNIAEGFGRRTDREFAQFLTHAHGSAAEVQAALYLALDLKYIDQATFDAVYASCEEISKMVFTLNRYLRG